MQLSREIWLASFLGLAIVAGCSGADEHPLGGPYGGTAGSLSGPTEGAGSAANATANDDGTNAAEDDTSADSDGGTRPKTDAGSSTTKTDGGSTSNNGSTGQNGSSQPTSATWTAIYNNYLAGGTIGNCTPCHSGMKTAAGAYAWLKRKGYINGATSGLADPQVSCLSWLGGNMPPNGPSSNANATADLASWAKAGGLQN